MIETNYLFISLLEHYGYILIYTILFLYKLIHLFMNSILQEFTQKYDETIQKKQASAKNSEKDTVELVKLQILAQNFIALILQFSSSEEVQQQSSPKFKDQACQMLENASKKIMNANLKRIIGQYIYDEVIGRPQLIELKTALHYEEDNDDKEIENSLQIFEEDDQIEKKLFSQIQKSFASSFLLQKQNSHQIWQENLHQIKVDTYLKDQLQSPQTQLSYLCQMMGWRLNFFSKEQAKGIFKVTAQVKFLFKGNQAILKESYSAEQKKLGRRLSSFIMLRRVYLSYPQIWTFYQQKRIAKGLTVVKDGSNNKLNQIQRILLKQQIKPIVQTKHKEQQFENEKQQYLTNITCFNSELHLLQQHNPDYITILQLEKKEISKAPQLWEVKREIFVNYNDSAKLYEMSGSSQSYKDARQTITKALVMEIYDDYKQLLQNMMIIKDKKGIKV